MWCVMELAVQSETVLLRCPLARTLCLCCCDGFVFCFPILGVVSGCAWHRPTPYCCN